MINMEILRRLVTGISRTLDIVSGWPGVLAIFAAGAIVVVGVTSRYAFNHPLHFIEEYSGYLNVVVIYFPLAWVLRHVGHIRLPLLVTALPRRAANYLEIATIFISLVVIIVLAMSVTQVVLDSFARGTRAWTLMATPIGPVQSVILVGLGLFTIQIIIDIAKRIKGQGAPPESTTNN